MEQMQQATEPVRIVCIQKSKVNGADLESLRGGNLHDVKELKCYVNCVLEMMQMVSNKHNQLKISYYVSIEFSYFFINLKG